jgi:DNA sulfur modification protein DndD
VLPADHFDHEINQIAPEQISRFFLFDGELLDQYEELLVEGSEQGRQIKEAIEQVLGVPSLTNGRHELGAILKAAQKRQAQDLAHVAGLQSQADRTTQLTTKLDSYEDDLRKLQEKLGQTRDERAKLDDELEAAASALALKAALEGSKTALKTHTETVERKLIEKQALLAEAWQDLLDAKLEVKRQTLRARQDALTNSMGDKVRLETQIGNIKQLLDTSNCPTCKQHITSDHRAHLGGELGKLQAALSGEADTISELHDVSGQIATLNRIRGVRARDRLAEINRDLRAAEVGRQKAENEIERIEEQVAGHDLAELARKRVLKDEKFKEEGRLTEAIKSVSREIQKTKDELAVTQKTIQGLTGARHQRSTRKVTVATDLEKTFQVSIERLRDSLRGKVQALSSEAFLKMTTQKSYKGLEINENYGLSISDSSNRKVSLRSAGAEQIVALSLIDGLNRTGRAIGPIVMDTPFGRLDLKHRDNVLSYLPTVASQFVLLVHGGEIRPESDLAAISNRIGKAYEIREISETQSEIVQRQSS